jgi:hypothetical protein
VAQPRFGSDPAPMPAHPAGGRRPSRFSSAAARSHRRSVRSLGSSASSETTGPLRSRHDAPTVSLRLRSRQLLEDFRKQVDCERGPPRNRGSMGDYDYDEHTGDVGAPGGSRRRGWTLLLAVVAALTVGVGLGYVWRSATEPDPLPAAPPPVAAPPPTSPPVVPSPCVAIAQRGTDLLAQLDAAARAVGALDPAALRQVLDEVRRLRDELQREVDSCRGQVGGAPAPASPGPEPPAAVPPTPVAPDPEPSAAVPETPVAPAPTGG